MSGSISLPKNNFPGVSCSVLLYDHRTSYALDVRILIHGATVSNVTLARSLVLRMILANWLIISKIAFACGFYSGACWFKSKIFQQWNKITLEFRAISEDYFVRPGIS